VEYANGVRGNRAGGQYDGWVDGGQSSPEVARVEGSLIDPRERLVDEFARAGTNPTGATERIYSDDVNAGSPAMADRISLNLWGIGSSTIHHGRDLDFPDTDRAAIFLSGHTISHAWTFCGVPCTSPPN